MTGVNLAEVIQLKVDGNGAVRLDNLYFGGESSNEPEPEPEPVAYCAKPVTHFMIEGETASSALLTVTQQDTGLRVSISSANEDAIDFINLIPTNASSTGTHAVDGVYSQTFAPNDSEQANIGLTIMWSKDSTDGNWMLDQAPVDFPLSSVCDEGGVHAVWENVPSTGPTEAAPTPTAAADSVLSIFSDSYDDLVGTDFNPDWGQSTQVSTDGGELTYTSLNYQGTAFAAAQDVSGYGYLHVDYFPTDSTALDISLIGGGVEFKYALTGANGQWNSVDIALTEFTGVDLAGVIQFKVDGNGSVTFDNLYFGGEASEPEPEPELDPAPAPTAAADSVLSIFSDAYTDVVGTDFNPSWGQSTQVSTDGGELTYTSLNYQGTAFAAAQDVSGYGYLHVDYFPTDSTALDIYLIGGGVEFKYALTGANGQWNSVDIALTEFTGVDLAGVIQFKVDGNGSVRLDNLYFGGESSNEPEPEPEPFNPVVFDNGVVSAYYDLGLGAYDTTPGSSGDCDPANDCVSIATSIVTDADRGDVLLIEHDDTENLGLVFAKISGLGGDFSAYAGGTLTFDVKTVSGDSGLIVKIDCVHPCSSGEQDIGAFGASGWETVTVQVNAMVSTGLNLTKVNTGIVIWAKSKTSSFLLDNVQWNLGNGDPEPELEAAPTPTVAADSVLSIFSDAYTDVAGTDFYPNWGQSTSAVIADGVLTYTNLNFQGTAFAAAQDVSGYGYLHVDYYATDSTELGIFLIGGGETEVLLDGPNGQWNSVDIPLTSFTAVNLAEVIQFKVDGNGKVVFDNWYFGGVAPDPEPEPELEAAPTPTAAADSVLSIFSDAYTDVVGTDFNPNWGQSTQVSTDGGELTYTSLNYQGTAFAAAQDVSGYGYLHVDYFATGSTDLGIFLVGGGEVEYLLTGANDQWNSVDIPLTAFDGVNLAEVIQLKVDGNGAVRLDNLYFGGDAPSDPTVDTDGDGVPDAVETSIGRDPLVVDYMVSAGREFTCALDDSDAGIACFGGNFYGQATPPTLSNPTFVTSGYDSACAIDDTGVVCWGRDNKNKLTVPALSNPTTVSTGRDHSCAIDDTGLVCWGTSWQGRGRAPANITGATQVSTSNEHTCVIADGGVSCWGNPAAGRTSVPTLSNPTAVSAGYFHSCAIDDNGVSCWG